MIRIPGRVIAIEAPQFDLLNDAAARWRSRGADVINLGQAVPGFPPPPLAVETLRAALEMPSSHVYSADAGIPELRQALSDSLASVTGSAVDPETEIIITAGGNQAFQLALTTLIEPGDEVVLGAPYFLNHEMAVRSVGAIPIEAPLDPGAGFAATFDALAPWLSPRTRAVVLVSPGNPTGAVTSPQEFARITAECEARNVMVFVDETYLRFVYDDQPYSVTALPNWQRNVVVVGSFSKAFAVTGWRCGYLIAAAPAIEQALKIQDCMVICAPVPIQRAIAAVLAEDSNYTSRWMSELSERRTRLLSALAIVPGAEAVKPSGGFFVMVRIEGCRDSQAFATDLIEQQQVVTIPGQFFGRSGQGYLRLSYGAAAADRLEEACGRLANVVSHAATGGKLG